MKLAILQWHLMIPEKCPFSWTIAKQSCITISTQFSQKGNSSRQYDAFPLTRFDGNGHLGKPHFPMPSKILLLVVSVAKLAVIASLGVKISWRKILPSAILQQTNKRSDLGPITNEKFEANSDFMPKECSAILKNSDQFPIAAFLSVATRINSSRDFWRRSMVFPRLGYNFGLNAHLRVSLKWQNQPKIAAQKCTGDWRSEISWLNLGISSIS